MKRLCLLVLAVSATIGASAQSHFKHFSYGVKVGAGASNMELSVKEASPALKLGLNMSAYAGGVINYAFSPTWGLQAEFTYNYGGTRLGVSLGDVADNLAGGGNYSQGQIDTMLNRFPSCPGVSIMQHSASLPLLVTYQANKNVSLMAGLTFNYLFTTKTSYNSDLEKFVAMYDDTDIATARQNLDQLTSQVDDFLEDNLNKFTLGMSLGAEYKFTQGMFQNFFIDARYSCSLTNAIATKLDMSASSGGTMDVPGTNGVSPFLRYSNMQLGIGYRF